MIKKCENQRKDDPDIYDRDVKKLNKLHKLIKTGINENDKQEILGLISNLIGSNLVLLKSNENGKKLKNLSSYIIDFDFRESIKDHKDNNTNVENENFNSNNKIYSLHKEIDILNEEIDNLKNQPNRFKWLTLILVPFLIGSIIYIYLMNRKLNFLKEEIIELQDRNNINKRTYNKYLNDLNKENKKIERENENLKSQVNMANSDYKLPQNNLKNKIDIKGEIESFTKPTTYKVEDKKEIYYYHGVEQGELRFNIKKRTNSISGASIYESHEESNTMLLYLVENEAKTNMFVDYSKKLVEPFFTIATPRREFGKIKLVKSHVPATFTKNGDYWELKEKGEVSYIE